MQIFERSDGVRVEAVPFVSFEDDFAAYSQLIDWLAKNGVSKTNWHARQPTDEWIEGEDGEPVQLFNAEHLMLIKDDLEAGVDAAGVEHVLTIKDGYETRVDVGDMFVLREGDVYSMDPSIFEAVFTPIITDDPDDWEWLMGSRLPYTKTLGYWNHKYDRDLVSVDGGVTYWRESERRRYQPTADAIHTSEKKEANA